jgi:DNA processing protein
MVRGNRALLERSAVGVVGSREASPHGLRAAEDCADQLAAADVVVTSGYAAGVDTNAHRAALQRECTTIIVLAEGITHFRVKPELERLWSWDRACVISEFAADAPWSAGNAVRRNKTIVGLSRAMIVAESRATGGSMATGRIALDADVPIFATEFKDAPNSAIGNRHLIELGATPLLRSRRTMRANLDPVFSAIRGEANRAASRQVQLFSDTGSTMNPDWEHAWSKEIEQRVNDVTTERIDLIDADEVHRALRVGRSS